MDRAQHERFRQYLERFVYFGRGGDVRLEREQFAQFDEQYRRLQALERRTAAEEETLKLLRVALLKD